jgi:hypothetical protein
MWREKDMPVGPRDVIKAFELQRLLLHEKIALQLSR